MEELTAEQKPSGRIWLWLILNVCALLCFWLWWLSGPENVNVATFTSLSAAVLLMVIGAGSVYKRGMFGDWWRKAIRGYDRVWFLVPDKSESDGNRMDSRIEPSWQRNALLSGDAPGRYPFCVYQRVSGWRRAFRIGRFVGTPYILWRDDLKVSPNYGDGGLLDSLDVRDRRGLCVRFTLDEMLVFLNVTNSSTLELSISNLLRRHEHQSVRLSEAAETIKRLEDGSEGHRQKYSELAAALDRERREWLRTLKVSEAYGYNMGNLVTAAQFAFNAVSDYMRKGTRYQRSSEGSAVFNALQKAVVWIELSRDNISKIRAQNETTQYATLSEETAREVCFPKRA